MEKLQTQGKNSETQAKNSGSGGHSPLTCPQVVLNKKACLKVNRKIWTNGCNSYRCCNTAWCLRGDCSGYLSYVKQKIASDTVRSVSAWEPCIKYVLILGDFFITVLNTRKITVWKGLFTSHSFGRPPYPRGCECVLNTRPLVSL